MNLGPMRQQPSIHRFLILQVFETVVSPLQHRVFLDQLLNIHGAVEGSAGDQWQTSRGLEA